MSAKLKFGNVILCEYVVQGMGNKPTLINVYSADILVAALPARLNLGMYIEYLPDTDGDADITIEIRVDKKPVAHVGMLVENAKRGQIAVLAIPSFPVSIPSDTTIEVAAIRKGYKKTEIIAKSISKGLGSIA